LQQRTLRSHTDDDLRPRESEPVNLSHPSKASDLPTLANKPILGACFKLILPSCLQISFIRLRLRVISALCFSFRPKNVASRIAFASSEASLESSEESFLVSSSERICGERPDVIYNSHQGQHSSTVKIQGKLDSSTLR
jgi:hypothetical protein